MPHLCLCLSHVNAYWRCRLSLGGLEGCHPYAGIAVRLAGVLSWWCRGTGGNEVLVAVAKDIMVGTMRKRAVHGKPQLLRSRRLASTGLMIT